MASQQDAFAEKWKALPLHERKKRLDQCFWKLKPSLKQILELIKTKENDGTKLDEKHLFLFTSLRSFIEHNEFLFALGKNKYKKMAYYPMRTILEICGKINYFLQSDEQTGKNLIEAEILSESRTWYKYAKKHNDTDSEEISKKLYYKVKNPTSPEIDCSHEDFRTYTQINGFPNMSDCLNKGKIPGAIILYDMYKSASSRIHGSFMAALAGKVTDEDGLTFLWYAQLAVFAILHTLEMADIIFYGKIQQATLDIKKLLKKSQLSKKLNR